MGNRGYAIQDDMGKLNNVRFYIDSNDNARPDLVNTSMYGISAMGGTANIGKNGSGYRHFFFSGQQDRIRQTGSITQIKMYIGNISNTTNLYIRIWRFNGSTYDIVATSENFIGKVTDSNLQTITLDTPLSVQEGDFIGVKVIATGSGYQMYSLSSLGTGHEFKYIETTGPDSNGFDWDGLSATSGTTVPIECYMTAPQVVFIGDSIVAGHPAHYSFCETTKTTSLTTNMPHHFGVDAEMTYQNLGIGSQTTTNIETRFESDVLPLKPKYVVINGGVNDIAGGVITLETFLANYDSMLYLCQANNIYAIVLGIAPWTNGTNEQMRIRDNWNQELESLCNNYGNVIFINPEHSVGQLRANADANNLWDIRTGMGADGVHFNTTGHNALAGEVIRGILTQYATFDYIKPNYEGPAIINGKCQDSAYSIGVVSNNLTPLVTSGSKIHAFFNNGIEKASVNYDGAIQNTGVRLTPEGGIAVRLLNLTGSTSVKGEVVTANASTNNAVSKIIVDIPNPIGVFYESGVADGNYAWVVVSGMADVYFVGNTTRGDIARGFLTADGGSYVTGQALSEALPTSPFASDMHFYEIGHVLESRTGAGLAKCVLHFN